LNPKTKPRVIWQAVDHEDFPRRWVLETDYDKLLAENQRLKEALELIRVSKGWGEPASQRVAEQALETGGDDG
jgi:hypothetical protein